MKKKELADILKTMLASGEIVESMSIKDLLLILEGKQTLPQTYQEKVNQFKQAYLAIGNGRPYVYICQIRDHLNWPIEFFNEVVRLIARQGIVELCGGDPSEMTAEQIEKSYRDSWGYLLISVCWR